MRLDGRRCWWRVLVTLAAAISVTCLAFPAAAAPRRPDVMRATVRCEDGSALTNTPGGLQVLLGACEESQRAGAFPPPRPFVPAEGPADCLVPGFDDRCERWVAPPYDGPWSADDYPGFGSFDRHTTVLAHPTEDLVFVGGTSAYTNGGSPAADFVEIAYRASTGLPVWTSTYAGGYQHSFALSPDGDTLYAIGDVIAAFDSATGRRLWNRSAPIFAKAIETAMTTLPDGTVRERIYLAGVGGGTSPSGAPVTAGAVAALEPQDGSTIWSVRFAGKTEKGARFNELVVSPDGSAVYAGGGEHLPDGSPILPMNFATVGFRAMDGEKLWEARDERTQPTRGDNGISDMKITPDGSRVLVTGFDAVFSGQILSSTSPILTVAHDASTGAVAWRRSYGGPVAGETHFYFSLFQGMMGLSPDGRTAVVTAAINSHNGTATVAYDVATGNQKWGVESNDAMHAYVFTNYLGYYPAVVVGDDRAFVSNRRGFGYSQYRTVTMGYSLDAGVLDWTGRLGTNRTLFGGNAMSADGKSVFVTTADRLYDVGFPAPNPGLDTVDILTVAYDA